MRATAATLAASLAALAGILGAAAAPAAQAAAPQQALVRSLNSGMHAAGNYSGAYVQDLTTGRILYSHNARTGRLPASVEKLLTTSTALLKFGPQATLTTSVLGTGQLSGSDYAGTLYLRGGGDPSFGSASFDRASYGAGATMQRLVSNLASATGIQALDGNIVADESTLDSVRGTPATSYAPSLDVEGELSGLAYDRGWANNFGTVFYRHPALVAGQQFATALKAAGTQLSSGARVRAGHTPPSAQLLASVHSPSMTKLIALTNTPSDNYFAETLVKDLGARFGGGGTTAAGAAVVRAQASQVFKIHPRLNDGSGLSRYDLVTPFDIVSLLRQMVPNPAFTNSLAVAGQTGTLQNEMRGTLAQGRCRGKTGTLSDVSNLVGYCQGLDGHTLAFAFMMNGIYPTYAHPIQNRMAIAVAGYRG
jgi:D-alanyl-D-alanine carboxypeptidase/D-alanyl-D-alanine-endopeptidase (penicillin-binding protein 4)